MDSSRVWCITGCIQQSAGCQQSTSREVTLPQKKSTAKSRATANGTGGGGVGLSVVEVQRQPSSGTGEDDEEDDIDDISSTDSTSDVDTGPCYSEVCLYT